MVRHSFSFLQDAEMVSEVANSKYQSLFFILKDVVVYYKMIKMYL